MANNRELSQFGSFISVNDTNKKITIGSTITKVLTDDLEVLGLSTLGIVTATNINISGVATASIFVGNASLTSLNVSGITTVGYLTGTNANFIGVVTANSFVTLGPTSLDSVTINNIKVTGITTLGVSTATTLSAQIFNISGISTLGTVKISSGIITATSGVVTYYGDGSNLQSISASSIVGIVTSAGYASTAGTATIAQGLTENSNINTTGIITATSFVGNLTGSATTSTDVIGGIGSIRELSVSGITTLGFLTATNINATGIVTATKFVGNLTGIASTAIDVIGGIGSIRDLRVSGITTVGFLTGSDAYFSGIVTAREFVVLGTSGLDNVTINNLKVNETTTLGITTASSLYVTGITSVGFLTGSDAYFSGIVTATKFVGNLTGIASTAIDVIGGIGSLSSLYVSGITTVGFLTGSDAYFSGIVTAREFVVLGTSGLDNVTINNLKVNETTTLGITTASSLYVTGITSVGFLTGSDAYFSGIVTATKFVGNLTGIASTAIDVIGGIGSIRQLSVSGITTLGITTASSLQVTGITTLGITSIGSLYVSGITTLGITTASSLQVTGITTLGAVKISSGIITSSNPGVTTVFYYGDGSNLTGIEATSFTGIATVAKKLEEIRYFNITGDIVSTTVSFDGTANVSLASTISDHIVGLGTKTYGDYVKNITGTAGEVEVSLTSGEGVSPQIGLPDDVTIGRDLKVSKNLQVDYDLNVNGNITVGGTSAYLNVTNLQVQDKDIILGITTNVNGTDISTDITANHGGIAIASTVGTPLVSLAKAGISSIPDTYKQIMWVSKNTMGVGTTDAWLFNYGVGIGSTQVANGVRLAVGSEIKMTDDTITAKYFYGDGSNLTDVSATSFTGIATVAQKLQTAKNFSITGDITSTTVSFDGTQDVTLASTLSSSININTTGIITASKFVGNLTGIATTAINVIGGIGSITSLSVSGISTLGTVKISSGIITSSNPGVTTVFYYGDGGGLTGVTAASFTGIATVATKLQTERTFTISGNQFSAISTSFNGTQNATIDLALATQSGVTSGVYGNSNTIPIFGINSSGIVTSTSSVTITAISGNAGTATTATNVIGGIGSITSLSVSGISTLGTVKISSGIITATSGVVTYYGDGSGLTGVTAASFTGIATVATKLQTERTFTISGNQFSAISTSFDGTQNATIGLSLATQSGVTSGVYGNSSSVPVFGVNSSGIITSTSSVTITAISGNAGTATTATNVIGGIGSLTSLSVSGITTLGTVKISSGIITATSGVVTYYGDGSNLTGVTATSFTGIATVATKLQTERTFNILGNQFSAISTSFDGTQNATIGLSLATQSGVTSGVYGNSNTIPIFGVNSSGIVTSTSSVTIDSVSGNAGTATTATNVIGGIGSLTSLSVSGITTLGTVKISSGIITSSNPGVTTVFYYGDGSNLTGITATSFTGIATVAEKLKTERTFTISGNQFSAISTSFNGTQNATISLALATQSGVTSGVYGNSNTVPVFGVNSSGIITSTSSVTIDSVSGNAGTATTATNVIGGIGSITSLSVSGISTLGTVKISSGIITATSGVVTYYGDGSGLTNLKASAISGDSNISISSNSNNQTQYLTFATGIGSTTGLGISTTNLVFNPFTTRLGIGITNPTQTLQVQGDARVTGGIYDSTNSPGTTGQVLQSTGNGTGTQWTTAAGGSGKFDTTIDSVLYVQPTGTLDIVGVGITTSQITTFPAGSNEYIVHSIHVTNISNGDAEVTAGFIMNARKVPATISVSAGSSGGPGIHTFTVGSASSITVGMAVTGTGNIGETTGIGTTAGFQYNTYITSVDGNNITLSKPMSGRATGTLIFSPVSKVSSRLPVPVGSAVELLKQPMVLNALDSIVLQSTGAGTGIGTISSNTITYTSGNAVLTVTNQDVAFFNSIAIGNLVQNTGTSTGIQTNTYVGASYTGITTSYAGTGVISIPITRPVNATVGVATVLSFTEIVVPEDGALQATIVYQSTTDTSYLNGTGTVAGISTTTSVSSGISSIPVAYYGTGNTYPSIIQSIRVSNISDGMIYPGGDYPVWVGIGNSDTVFSWLAYNMMIPRNSSIELCEGPKRLGIGQSIFAYSNTPYAIEIQIAGKQKI